MNVASLENCKRLYELSGWERMTSWVVRDNGLGDRTIGTIDPSHQDWLGVTKEATEQYPAYDAGYLLRKLPKEIDHKLLEVRACVENRTTMEGWHVIYSTITNEGNTLHAFADTPENALCKLAIILIENGILDPVQEKQE